MKEVILLVGPQGAGKSTYAKSILYNYYRISQDDMGQKAHFDNYKKALKEQQYIVVDRINHTREQRHRYLSLAKEAGFKTRIVVMNKKYKTCLDAIKSRESHPTLKKDDDKSIHAALTMYFNNYEYVTKDEADEVTRLFPFDPFLIDITHITASKRVILVGDVHGCHDEMQLLLAKCKYEPKHDVLIFTGDLVDRGPKILGTLKYVKAGYDRGLVFTVMSNHEFKYLRYLRGNKVTPSHGLQETIDQVGLNEEYRYWLEELPYVIKFRPDTYIVHAGVIPTKDIERQRRDSLIFTRTFNPITKSYNDKDAEPFYQFQPKDPNLKLFFGHQQGLRFDVSNWAKALDGGCVHGGVLRACIVNKDNTQEIVEVSSSYNWNGDDEVDTIHPSLQPYEIHYQNKMLSKSEKGDLVSYKYTDQCTYSKTWDDYTRQARGIIFNKKTGKVIAKPFDKFFNLNEMPETSITQLPRESYEVFDKLDGSLGILYYEKKGEPQIATCGSFHSIQALEATKMLKEKYKNLENHHEDITLLFEIIYPANKIVCDYGDRRELVLLAAINKKTNIELSRLECEEIAAEYGFPIAEKFEYSINDMIELQKTLPKDKEGFIVRFASGLRVKIKGEEYLRLHRVVSGITPLFIWREMKNGKLPDSYLKAIPEELLPDVNIIGDKLIAAYDEVHTNFLSELALHFMPFLKKKSDGLPFDKTDAKLVGLRIKELGSELKYASAIFPWFLKKYDIVDNNLKERIRPTGNKL